MFSMAAAGATRGMFMGNLGGLHLLPDLFLHVIEIMASQDGLFRFFFLCQPQSALFAGQSVDSVDHFLGYHTCILLETKT